jgi:uncharacterized protein (TIGR03067 family)
VDGTKASDEDLKKVTLLIDTDGKATVQAEGRTYVAGTIQIDPTGNPKTMDITFTHGDAKGQTSLGIYKIEGDLVTICRATPDRDRPTDFSSKPGSGHALMTYRRQNSDARKDVEQLRGTWACVSGERNGQPIPEATVRQLRLVLTDTKYATYRGDDLLFESDYKLAPTKTPAAIDTIGTEGEHTGRPAQGIYRLDGDTLKLCYTMPGRDRPKEFESKAGSEATLTVWKRAKP